MRCCLCGRPVFAPTLFIGRLPVGSTCARRAGLVELGRKRAGAVRILSGWWPKRGERDTKTRDLFEEPAHG